MKEVVRFGVLFITILSVVLICNGDDFSPRIHSVADVATNEIRRLKLSNGEHNKCTQLKADIISARTQAMPGHEGVKYSLQLRVSPLRVEGKRCAHIAESMSTDIWQPELCDVEVLERSRLKEIDQSTTIVRSACLKIED